LFLLYSDDFEEIKINRKNIEKWTQEARPSTSYRQCALTVSSLGKCFKIL